MQCPNKNLPEWKALVSQYGEAGAYKVYVENNFDIPNNMPRLLPERTNEHEYIKNVYRELSDRIGFISDTHEYYNKITGVKYKPVSTVKQEYGYGDNMDESTQTDAFKEHYSLSSRVGTTIHDYLNKMLTGVKYEELDNVKLSNSAKKSLDKLVNTYKKHGTILASEQVLADDASGIAGTMDLELLTKSNEILQLDYKTKIVDYLDHTGKSTQGYRKVPFKYYTSTRDRKSDKLKHDFQQTLYKRMQELLDIDVKYKGIVPLEVVMMRNQDGSLTIHDVRLTTHLPLDDTFGYYNLVSNNHITPIVNDILGITSNIESQTLDLSVGQLEELADKGLVLLKKRAGFLRAVGDEYNAMVLEDEISNISLLDPVKETFSIIKVANSLMKPYMVRYNQLLQEEKSMGKDGHKVWDLKTLQGWRDFASAFDSILDDIKIYYDENPDMFNNIEGINKNDLDYLINETLNSKNALLAAYKNKGMKQWLDWIAKDSKIIEYNFRSDFQKDYKKNWKLLNKDAKFSKEDVAKMEEATNNYIANNQKAIELETRRFIKAQADMATEDINFVYRWADTIFDTKDPIVGVMSKIYYDKMREMRVASNDFYKRLSDIMDEFDKKYDNSSFSNQREVYDYMLDYRDGSAYILERIPQSFREAYEAKRNELSEKYTNPNERSTITEEIMEWLNEHAPYVENAEEHMKEARITLYFDEYSRGDITEDEYNALIQNEDSGFKKSVKSLSKDGDIRPETAFRLGQMIREIRWEHRSPDRLLYPNPKWDILEKMDVNDPKRQLYDFIKETSNIGNAYVPKRFKIGNRLPGVRKSSEERAYSGQNIGHLIKEGITDTLSVKSDDTTRGQFELANEVDKGLEFVPVHYTTALSIEDQSFDLPNLYKLWYKSILNYDFTRQILPEMEYTRFIINNRKVVKKSRGKEVINKLSRIYNSNNENTEGIDSYVTTDTNRLAEQLNSWFSQWIYGKKDNYLGEYMGVDFAKSLRLLQKFSSLKIMGFNLLSMVNNSAMAEVAQLIESNAGRLMNKRTYAKATKAYIADLPDILSDLGARSFKSKTNLALEYFNVFFDMQEKSFMDRSKLKRLAKESALFWTTSLGEHEVQSRFLIGALMSTDVKDKSGKSIGNLWDNLEVVNGELQINKNADLDLFTASRKISRDVTQVLREMHGNYTDYSTTAMSANGILSLVQQFRKWIIPGVRRRFDKEYFSEFSEIGKIGYIRSGLPFYKNYLNKQAYSIARFFGKVIDESKALDLAVAADFNMLSDPQKQAVKRLNMDIAILVMLTLLYNILAGYKDDDDYDNMSAVEKAMYNNLTYQVYRITTEQTFYVNPADFMRIMQSPMAGMSVATSWIGVLDQAMPWNATEQYTTGKRKGDYKLAWKVYQQIPVARQLYRVANSEESLQALVSPTMR